MIFATTLKDRNGRNHTLWFAFVLWIYDICHNVTVDNATLAAVVICFRSLNLWYLPQRPLLKRAAGIVVICFRSLNLWYLPQHLQIMHPYLICCDLLSFFEFMIFATTMVMDAVGSGSLWFAFVLWIYDICHNFMGSHSPSWGVVICFRSLNLWYLPQRGAIFY